MAQHILMADEFRRICEDVSAGRVIAMMVAIEYVAHGYIETTVEFALEPGCKPGVNRVGQDDVYEINFR